MKPLLSSLSATDSTQHLGWRVLALVNLVRRAANPAIEPILMVESFYHMATALAFARGFDPDKPPHLNKVTETL